VTIKVASKNTARPLINKGVCLGISDFWLGGFTDKINTDSNEEVIKYVQVFICII